MHPHRTTTLLLTAALLTACSAGGGSGLDTGEFSASSTRQSPAPTATPATTETPDAPTVSASSANGPAATTSSAPTTTAAAATRSSGAAAAAGGATGAAGGGRIPLGMTPRFPDEAPVPELMTQVMVNYTKAADHQRMTASNDPDPVLAYAAPVVYNALAAEIAAHAYLRERFTGIRTPTIISTRPIGPHTFEFHVCLDDHAGHWNTKAGKPEYLPLRPHMYDAWVTGTRDGWRVTTYAEIPVACPGPAN